MTGGQSTIWGKPRESDAAEVYVQLSAAFGFTDREIDAMTYVRAMAYLGRVPIAQKMRRDAVLGGVIEALALAFGKP